MNIEFRSNFRDGQKKLMKLGVNTKAKGHLVMGMLGDSFIKYAHFTCPEKTGRLSDSIGDPSKEGIYEWFMGGKGLRIGTTVPYARAINEGIRRPYIIMPRKAKMLKFTGIDGEDVYAHQVTHPPTAGKFFMNSAIIMARRDLPDIVKQLQFKG